MVRLLVSSLTACALLLTGGTTAFSPISPTSRNGHMTAAVSLDMSKMDRYRDEQTTEQSKADPAPERRHQRADMLGQAKRLTAAAVASACLLSGIVAGVGIAAPDAALAHDGSPPAPAIGASTVLLSARSGGRMGGRAGGGYRGGGGGYRGGGGYGGGGVYRSGATIVRPGAIVRPTIVAPMAPPPIMFGSPFYSPFGGFGFGYGALGAAREYSQESEIQRSRAEIEMYKQKEAEMERRIQMLEQQQQQGQGMGTGSMGSQGAQQQGAENVIGAQPGGTGAAESALQAQ